MRASAERSIAHAVARVCFVAGGTVFAVAVTAGLGCRRDRDEPRSDGPAAARTATILAATAPPAIARTPGANAVPPADALAPSNEDTLAHADTRANADADTPARFDAGRERTVENPPDPSNKTRPPSTSADLGERAAHLIDALVQNDPTLADDFFFPRAPFIPLKDVADPGRYFDQLLATYHRDVRSLRAERKDWTGASFVSFELGTTPTWVAPGKEYNKIGYFRTFGGKLRYRVGEKVKEIVVSTIISWDGRWYVTHLLPIKH